MEDIETEFKNLAAELERGLRRAFPYLTLTVSAEYKPLRTYLGTIEVMSYQELKPKLADFIISEYSDFFKHFIGKYDSRLDANRDLHFVNFMVFKKTNTNEV